MDYVSTTLKNTTIDNNGKLIEDSASIKTNIEKLANNAQIASQTNEINLGQYLGTSYYTGNKNAKGDVLVTSKVRQIIDYVDNDALFTQEYNETADHYWRNTSITELTGNGLDEERLVSREVIPEYEIVDKKNISYKTAQRNNLILSVDDQNTDAGNISNAYFERELIPYSYYSANVENNLKAKIEEINNNTTLDNMQKAEQIKIAKSSYEAFASEIILTVTKTVSAQDDSDNMAYDNLAEIVKIENSVGRRDMSVVVGNAVPKNDEFTEALKERDSSATELITFTPPTGIEVEEGRTTQILILVITSLAIVIGGIIIIKKKVLK